MTQDTPVLKDEFVNKSFRKCAEIIVGNPKDKEWTDKQIDELCKQHERLIATKQTEAKDEIRFDVTKDLYELADRNSTIKPEEVWKIHGKYLDQINGSIAELRNTKVEK